MSCMSNQVRRNAHLKYCIKRCGLRDPCPSHFALDLTESERHIKASRRQNTEVVLSIAGRCKQAENEQQLPLSPPVSLCEKDSQRVRLAVRQHRQNQRHMTVDSKDRQVLQAFHACSCLPCSAILSPHQVRDFKCMLSLFRAHKQHGWTGRCETEEVDVTRSSCARNI